MVVEKRQSLAQIYRFRFKKETLKICNLHPFLRTVITNNGNFKVNIEELCKSASRVMYTLLCSTNKFASGNLRVLIKIFNRMIFPICTYNCEVLGSTFFTIKFVSSDFLSKRQLKNTVDKPHCTFITQHKKWSFPLWIYSINVTKSGGNCWFGYIYWGNP